VAAKHLSHFRAIPAVFADPWLLRLLRIDFVRAGSDGDDLHLGGKVQFSPCYYSVLGFFVLLHSHKWDEAPNRIT
jgi:hypothetical protein